ncbi:hypothetical protein [Clostridium manihotivorum]|uniref:Uncharacterized protein n=1 Tax=Clostridium manihotivorum TaxID=2320868 RepID=A0A3R5UFN8_9CLOT|nr:hypothetical protein [Clostridium manihotivorum]QAA32564.1 hypothetical protein C1I91_13480 [Clostridium manihotivorum]
MSTISGVSNSWYIRNTTQVSSSNQQTSKVRRNDYEDQDVYQSNPNLIQATQNSGFTDPLSSLVTNGTITEDQETAIKDAFSTMRQSNIAGTYGSKPTNPITSLISSGVITKDQADSIKSAFKDAAKAHHHKRSERAPQIDNQLSSLVSSGTISSDQESAVKTALKTAMEKSASSDASGFVDPLDTLVTSGTITEAQKNAIKNVIMPPKNDETSVSLNSEVQTQEA